MYIVKNRAKISKCKANTRVKQQISNYMQLNELMIEIAVTVQFLLLLLILTIYFMRKNLDSSEI